MTEIRPRDRIFAAIALPVLAVSLYAWGWRSDAVKALDALAARHSSLVQIEDFDLEFSRASSAKKSAETALEAVRKLPPPVTRVKPDVSSLPAKRAKSLAETFQRHGLAILADEAAESEDAVSRLTAAGAVTGPAVRRFTLEGPYPAFVEALGEFEARQAAVLPAALKLDAAGQSPRWLLTVAF